MLEDSAGAPPSRRRGAGAVARWSRQRRAWWLLWAACPGLGWALLGRIEAGCGGLAAAWAAPLPALATLFGIGPALSRRIDAHRRHWGPDPLPAFLASSGFPRRVLVPGDPALPPAVHNLARPPLGLYWHGHGALWPLLSRRQAVAVVGTRRASPHGLAMAEAIGAALAQAGWPVVSGLAEGIDAAAHQGCLDRSGRPVAVLGTPLERVYPRHHQSLQAAVGQAGLLISELPAGTGVRAGHFAARNRLQVALARAVVVVECPLGSGALHSARLAWQEQLPLWVVPADTSRQSAVGSNRLLAQGATALLDPLDLVRQLGPGPLAHRRQQGPEEQADIDPQLLAAVGRGATLETLCQRLELPAAALAQRLLALELAGQVRAESGLSWRAL
ncbi:DNA-processing protein DprA [Synechococcus sp. GFB01]|uniref:DNA-processing protein DprA n=1 Tax=Synechococcus sp. GFB01 TaxID=1662190 RepID=UPI0009E90AE6|nr:DNA-processing protein DprA [Synechococcus sp. GFB01]